jgi:hypothetical protein
MIENLQYSNSTGGVIISRDQPLKVAEQFHKVQKAKGSLGVLRRYRHTWYRWERPRYRAVSSEEARVDLTEFVASRSEPTGASFSPRPGDVGAMRLSIREVGQ